MQKRIASSGKTAKNPMHYCIKRGRFVSTDEMAGNTE
jgi:hypothetical protein